MKIIEIKDRNPLLLKQLLEVWESSVKATHLFLSENEIEAVSYTHLDVYKRQYHRPALFPAEASLTIAPPRDARRILTAPSARVAATAARNQGFFMTC